MTPKNLELISKLKQEMLSYTSCPHCGFQLQSFIGENGDERIVCNQQNCKGKKLSYPKPSSDIYLEEEKILSIEQADTNAIEWIKEQMELCLGEHTKCTIGYRKLLKVLENK